MNNQPHECEYCGEIIRGDDNECEWCQGSGRTTQLTVQTEDGVWIRKVKDFKLEDNNNDQPMQNMRLTRKWLL